MLPGTFAARVVGPYFPFAQPIGMMQTGFIERGRPRMRRAFGMYQMGSVCSDAPSPTARHPSSRFCTAG